MSEMKIDEIGNVLPLDHPSLAKLNAAEEQATERDNKGRPVHGLVHVKMLNALEDRLSAKIDKLTDLIHSLTGSLP